MSTGCNKIYFYEVNISIIVGYLMRGKCLMRSSIRVIFKTFLAIHQNLPTKTMMLCFTYCCSPLCDFCCHLSERLLIIINSFYF